MIAQNCRRWQPTNQLISEIESRVVTSDCNPEFRPSNRRLGKSERSKTSQLSLLLPFAPSSQIYPTISLVPQRIALAPDRFYIWHQGDFEIWPIPIQFTELEARSLLPLVDGERDRAVILKIVESAMNGGA